jgi:hypothetical protein
MVRDQRVCRAFNRTVFSPHCAPITDYAQTSLPKPDLMILQDSEKDSRGR